MPMQNKQIYLLLTFGNELTFLNQKACQINIGAIRLRRQSLLDGRLRKQRKCNRRAVLVIEVCNGCFFPHYVGKNTHVLNIFKR